MWDTPGDGFIGLGLPGGLNYHYHKHATHGHGPYLIQITQT